MCTLSLSLSAKPSTAAEQIEKNAARAVPRAHCSFNNSILYSAHINRSILPYTADFSTHTQKQPNSRCENSRKTRFLIPIVAAVGTRVLFVVKIKWCCFFIHTLIMSLIPFYEVAINKKLSGKNQYTRTQKKMKDRNYFWNVGAVTSQTQAVSLAIQVKIVRCQWQLLRYFVYVYASVGKIKTAPFSVFIFPV